MIKNALYFIYVISGSFLTALLWLLQEFKGKPNTPSWIVDNEIQIGYLIFAIVVVVNVIYVIKANTSKDTIIERWTHMLIKHMLDQYLAEKCYKKTRITIFRPVKGWRTWTWYLWSAGFCNIRTNYKHNRTWLYWKRFPLPFATYLKQTDRCTSSNESRSMTIFKTTTRGLGYNGVVDKCFRDDEDSWYADAAPLQLTNGLPEKYPNDDSPESLSIREYMKKTFISEEYYDTLKAMNFNAFQLMAFPLRNSDETIWGIVIVDSEDDLKQDLQTQLSQHIGDYQVLFRSMCKSLQEK